MPPPVEDMSDDESTGESIPYNDVEEPKVESGDVKGAEEEGDEPQEEGVFDVEKILGHEFAKNGTLMLQVKWKGYEDPADQTLEPEENLLEGAKEVLEEYYRSQGGRPEKPVKQVAVRKRKSMPAPEQQTPIKAEPKKRRKPSAPLATAPPATETPDGNASDELDWVPKGNNWEKHIKKVDTIIRDPETNTLIVFLNWENGKKSKVSIETSYEKCPRKMLEFYEQHLVFRDA